jgi:copper chaperone CopZ
MHEPWRLIMIAQQGVLSGVPVDVPGVQGGLTVAYLKVTGMGCPQCGERLCETLLHLDGVSLAEAHPEAHLVGVLYNHGQVTPAQLVEAVASAADDGHHRYQAELLAKCRLK